MVKDKILFFLESVRRRVICMSETRLREEFEEKDSIRFRSFWSPSVYTMTIERYEIDDEEAREERSSTESTQSVEESRACTHSL